MTIDVANFLRSNPIYKIITKCKACNGRRKFYKTTNVEEGEEEELLDIEVDETIEEVDINDCPGLITKDSSNRRHAPFLREEQVDKSQQLASSRIQKLKDVSINEDNRRMTRSIWNKSNQNITHRNKRANERSKEEKAERNKRKLEKRLMQSKAVRAYEKAHGPILLNCEDTASVSSVLLSENAEIRWTDKRKFEKIKDIVKL
uniref:Uncharacterized protein n=1 Tax=Meloidogyne hapla TaxID=6305 RepID=A0A1I8B0R6_MELHA